VRAGSSLGKSLGAGEDDLTLTPLAAPLDNKSFPIRKFYAVFAAKGRLFPHWFEQAFWGFVE
jgi:hypothetical protein